MVLGFRLPVGLFNKEYMNLSELISKAQALLAEHGDLETLSEDNYSITSLEMEVAEKGQYPKSYEMPKGFKFIRITDSR